MPGMRNISELVFSQLESLAKTLQGKKLSQPGVKYDNQAEVKSLLKTLWYFKILANISFRCIKHLRHLAHLASSGKVACLLLVPTLILYDDLKQKNENAVLMLVENFVFS